MTLKNFLQGKELTLLEICEEYGLVYNVFVDGENIPYGLNVDTSNVPSGAKLTQISNFTLDGDILTVSNITLDINDVNMLSDF